MELCLSGINPSIYHPDPNSVKMISNFEIVEYQGSLYNLSGFPITDIKLY